jgi:hypothetical protein
MRREELLHPPSARLLLRFSSKLGASRKSGESASRRIPRRILWIVLRLNEADSRQASRRGRAELRFISEGMLDVNTVVINSQSLVNRCF